VIGEQACLRAANRSQLPVMGHLIDAVEATVLAIASGQNRPPVVRICAAGG
jgi:hypothetical protein